VLEGAKNELNDTDGSQVGNGYTRSVTFEFIVFYCLFGAACIYTLYSFFTFCMDYTAVFENLKQHIFAYLVIIVPV